MEFVAEDFIVDEQVTAIVTARRLAEARARGEGSVGDAPARRRRGPGGDPRLDEGADGGVLEPRLRATSLRINDVPASTGYGEPVQKLFNFRDGERVVGALPMSATDDAQGRAGRRRSASAASACASRSSRTASCRRAPGRRFAKPADGDEIVGVARVVEPKDVVCVVTSDARALICKVDELPELANPGRGVTVIKAGDDDGGRLRRRPREGQGRASSPRPTTARSCPSAPAVPRHLARRQGPRAQAQDQDRARDARPSRSRRPPPPALLN